MGGINQPLLSSCHVPGTRLGTSPSIPSSDRPRNPGRQCYWQHSQTRKFVSLLLSFAVLAIKLFVFITGMLHENNKSICKEIKSSYSPHVTTQHHSLQVCCKFQVLTFILNIRNATLCVECTSLVTFTTKIFSCH